MLETAPVFLYRIGNRNGNIFDYKVGILKYNPNECTISTILSSINPMVFTAVSAMRLIHASYFQKIGINASIGYSIYNISSCC